MNDSCGQETSATGQTGARNSGLGGRSVGSLFSRLLAGFATLVDCRLVRWHRLPTPLGLLLLLGMRDRLRQENLVDVANVVSPGASSPTTGSGPTSCARTPDGSCNDLASPAMGMAGTPFGRNVPLDRTRVDHARLLSPNPRVISNALLARADFIPVKGLNLLAAAWIQFMVHDWLNHEHDPDALITIPIEDPKDDWPEREMRVPRTRLAAGSHPGPTPVFTNTETHWWDASQLYGSSSARQQSLRTHWDGKLLLDDDGLLPVDNGTELAGFNDNWWIGLTLLHTLFVREHNAICDRLHSRYPNWSDEALFAHARLINAALLAKIHTLEWTPAILGHPTVKVGMRGNWWGLASEAVHRLLGRISDSEVVSGIPGSPTDHHGVPYAITEEFVAVYRLHPLIPDQFTFWSARQSGHAGGELCQLDLHDVSAQRTRTVVLRKVELADVAYSFGTMHPGAITLHNYPTQLRRLQKNGRLIDLAAVDILRDRERGVPRYNDFRQLVHRPRIRSFDDLTDNPTWAAELGRVYGDVNSLDLMVGLFAETPPEGFGFSDTAFRIFILMAARRLKSDRFFTTDYTPDVYTPEGIDWVENNDLRSVLRRHFGARGCDRLDEALGHTANAFFPWP